MSRAGEPCPAVQGTRNGGGGKLTPEKVAAIRLDLALGERQEAIARAFGITQGMVSAIKRGAAWRHVGQAVSDEERFEESVARLPFHECWEWIGLRNDSGYGMLSIGGVHRRAHRLAWERSNEREVPDGLCVLHRCDNRGCVRPDHLLLGTRGENNSDCAAKNRNAQGEVHHWAKLDEAQAAEIRSRARGGEDPRALAAEFGVSRSTVKDIENGRSWRHQEGL